jgi:hypothetical protein
MYLYIYIYILWHSQVFWVLTGRWVAWTLCYHLPVFSLAILNIRAFCVYGSAPTCLISDVKLVANCSIFHL